MTLKSAAPDRLHPATAVGPVSLIARDAAALADWYAATFGVARLAEADRALVLGGADGTPLVTLVSDPTSRPAVRRQPGLYHLAILLPTRADLGRWLVHAGRSGRALQGAADHLVSEAVYLSDPEGNGIEVYRDRPRADWPTRDGRIHMDNSRFDAAGVVAAAEAEGRAYGGLPDGTVMGHVHLKVKDVAASRAFYEAIVGFDVTEEGFPSALFLSAGGYHHHVGLNSWESAGRDRDVGVTGLDAVTLTLPAGSRDGLVARLLARGIAVGERGGNPAVVDPSGIRLVLLEGTADPLAALAAAGARGPEPTPAA